MAKKTRSKGGRPPIKRSGKSGGGRTGKIGTSMVTHSRFHGAAKDPKNC